MGETYAKAGGAGVDVVCGPVPLNKTSGPLVTLTLQPYGSTQLRVTEWPTLDGTTEPPGKRDVCPPPPQPKESCERYHDTLPPNAQMDVNLPGNDILPRGVEVSNSAASCWQLCLSHNTAGKKPLCEAWVFSRGSLN